VDGVSADLIAEVAERYKRGEGRNQIAEALRCRRQTVSQIIAKIQQTH
jgi:DNA invertase Pin-like site-specific DNA recombinase